MTAENDIEGAIRVFCVARYRALARKVIFGLQRLRATGVYGDDYPFRTVWDEYCHEQQEGPTELLADAWHLTVQPFFEDAVRAVPPHEVALLTIGAAWDLDERDDTNLGIRPDLIRERLEHAVAELAGARDMARFR